MKPIAETSYKTDEKKDFSPEEFAKAKTVCEFIIELTKAISRSGYYDANHPVSMEVKKGLYDAFKSALGTSDEIMLTCHDVEDKVDIHITGILDEPFNIRKLTHATTSDLFVPKLKDYFERKSLNSFVIKKYITSEHFESFIDIMSEPIAESADTSKLGDYLTKALADQDITEVSTVFKTDVVLLRGKLPWRVSIILRRLAKDLKVVPMFRSASEEKMKLIKRQIVEDIIRPLHQSDLLRDLIVNCDVIVDHITHLLEIDELEKLIISSIPSEILVDVSQSVLDVYEEIKQGRSDDDEITIKQRTGYLGKILNIVVQRIFAENLPEDAGFFEKLYEHKIINFDLLPEKLRIEIQGRKLAGEIILNVDRYTEKVAHATSREEIEKLILTFRAVMPELIRRGEWDVIGAIFKALCDLSLKDESPKTEMLLKIPDIICEGTEEIFAGHYIQSPREDRQKINDIMMKMKSVCITIVDNIFHQCKEPDVLKLLIELLGKKGEPAREWALKILNDRNQPVSMLNIALLVIFNVGKEEDGNAVKEYVRHPNSSIRAKALGALVKLNGNANAGIVVDALQDEEEKVRSQAANLIDRELSLSAESINRILLLVKERLKKKITPGQASFLAGLIKSIAKAEGKSNRENLENELMEIVADLLREKTGFLKFMKTEPEKEQMEIITACFSCLGKTGGAKSVDYLKKLSRGDSLLSRSAGEAVQELNKRKVAG